ncbi:NDP-sugar synthase [Candidatus Pacearchaeota archaeon]|nr:NDP-sugar synthase [Candidatus Pacearchaeota archaeon]
MKLLINTGGKGERLYPLTKNIPKPMVNVAGKPILHHLIDWAKTNLLNDIVLMNGHLADKVIDYFKDGKNLGVNITHSTEPYPLGSGGPIKYAKNFIDDRFVYISGDVFCAINFEKMLAFHEKNNADITVHVHKSSHPHDSDILQIDETGKVQKFISKHDDHTGAGELSNSGLCIMEPIILGLMDKEVFTFETYLYPKILENGLGFFAYHTEEFIADIGTPERLKRCEDFIISHPEIFSSLS